MTTFPAIDDAIAIALQAGDDCEIGRLYRQRLASIATPVSPARLPEAAQPSGQGANTNTPASPAEEQAP